MVSNLTGSNEVVPGGAVTAHPGSHDEAAAASIRPRLSLCMIVRNEEKRLPRCLASAMPWAGETIVVDTGSTDGTIALAERAGARVLHFAWRDDFAAARNHALAAATREWVLVLDADEILRVDDAVAWARALAAAPAAAHAPAAYSIDCHDRIDDGGVAVGPCCGCSAARSPTCSTAARSTSRSSPSPSAAARPRTRASSTSSTTATPARSSPSTARSSATCASRD